METITMIWMEFQYKLIEYQYKYLHYCKKPRENWVYKV